MRYSASAASKSAWPRFAMYFSHSDGAASRVASASRIEMAAKRGDEVAEGATKGKAIGVVNAVAAVARA